MIEFRRALSTLKESKVNQWRLSRPCAFCLRQQSIDTPEGSQYSNDMSSGKKRSVTSVRHSDWCDECDAMIVRNRHACPCCAEPMASAALSMSPCARCLLVPPAFQHTFAPLRYEGLVAGLFQRYKDQHQRRAGRLLGLLMQRELTPLCKAWLSLHPEAVVILVPADERRQKLRGHDPLSGLYKLLEKTVRKHPQKVARLRDDASSHDDQRLRGRRGRLKAQRGRYDIIGPLPASVMLIDDVMTSGATLDSLALACRQAGAREVVACVLARTPLSTAAATLEG